MLLLALLLACRSDKDPHTDSGAVAPLVGDGLLTQGCPVPGEASARLLLDEGEAPDGPDALATPGDAVLISSKAAFVISGVDEPQTYYHYGGVPIDAVALEGCEQAGPETLGELGLVIGKLELTDFVGSALHQFHGTSLEIVNDGADGEAAVVEVHGTDDRFWLVEMTLLRSAYNDGDPRTLSPLWGLDVSVRYTLDPDSDVLQMDITLDGEVSDDGFLVGGLLFPSDHTSLSAYSSSNLSFGGFTVHTGVPWITDGGPVGSHAYAMPGAALSQASVAGVTAMLDLAQASAELEVNGAGAPPSVPMLLSVSAGDPASAGAALEPYLPEPLPLLETSWADLQGQVVDPAGLGVAGAHLHLYAPGEGGDWTLLDRLITGEDGAFSSRVLNLGEEVRLVASADGRDDSEPTDLDLSTSARVEISVGPVGAVALDVTDGDGAPSPARVQLDRDDGYRQILYVVPGDSTRLVPPGSYTATVTRGYEYAIVTQALTVPEEGEATLAVRLERLLDTAGWASMDSHVHAGPSPDSDTLAVDRMRTAAAAGLDLVISTDHEAIVDLSGALDEAGVSALLGYALGSEVTCTVPEHINAWPFPVDDSQARGAPVRWYGQGFPDVYAAIRERGASVIQLNHSRVNGECGVLCVADWDRMGDDPHIDDPTALGLDEGEAFWSWDFDSFEVMNSLRSPFLLPDDPRHSGALYDWMAFLNLGHRVTGTAVTDIHGLDIPGSPRNFVRVDDDGPGAVTDEAVAAGVLAGASSISAGAFVELTVDGAGPGEDVSVDGEGALAVKVQALPEIDVTRLVVLANCEELTTLEASAPTAVVKLEQEVSISLDEDAWIISIAFGEGAMPTGFDDYDPATVPRAITNPVFVDADGDGTWTPPGARACSWAP